MIFDFDARLDARSARKWLSRRPNLGPNSLITSVVVGARTQQAARTLP